MKDKEKQRELIVEIMKADEQSGLYTTRKQTAVDWLVNEINKMNVSREATLFINKLKKQAKQMEKEQIEEAFLDGYKSHPYLAEQYYKENYE